MTETDSDATAALRNGLRYLLGRGAPTDPARGIAIIDRAAQAGNVQAAWLAATIAGASFWGARDWDKALDYLARAAEGGHAAARSSLAILAGGPAGAETDGADWRTLRAAVDLDAWLTPPSLRVVRESPLIQIIEKFAPARACDWLIGQARNRLARATIYDRTTGGKTEDGRRTNSQCNLDIETCGVLTFVLRGRIGAITSRQDVAMEIPKVLHYAPGDTFDNHFDFLDPKEPAYAGELAMRGQRTETFLLYLNEGFSGGETHFPLIGFSHVGARGDALMFRNVDAKGAPDPQTMHAGLPPTAGEKWVFSQWIREFPRD